jgi:hypothetical protein
MKFGLHPLTGNVSETGTGHGEVDAPDDVRGQIPVVAGIAQGEPLIERGVAPRHRATVVEIGSKQLRWRDR